MVSRAGAWDYEDDSTSADNGKDSGSSSTTTTPAATAAAPPSLEDQMTTKAGQMESEETRRYEQGLGTLTDAFRRSQEALTKGVDSNLLFSQAADALGARGGQGLEAIRRSLGSRGLNPNSGAAQGMLQRLLMGQQGAITGATRDIGIFNQQQRVTNAGINFSNATNLAIQQQAPVSGIGYENMQNQQEAALTREGIAAGVQSNRAASKDNKNGAIGGGLLGLIGSGLG